MISSVWIFAAIGKFVGCAMMSAPFIGEVQVADVPGRCEPGTGEINYPRIAKALREIGYQGTVGMEAWASGDSELALELKERAKRVYVIGEAANEIGVALELAGVDHQRNGDLEGAVKAAAAAAQPGDVVLLAPACTSYDQFRDFEERGEAFKRLVANITG